MNISTNKNSKGQVTLSHDEPVPQALRRILLSLLETMCAKESGVNNKTDPDFLHDYRVAVRRTRSLLDQLKKVIPPVKQKTFKEEYAWLSALTGPARDYDVMLLELSDYQEMLSDYQTTDFMALRDYLQQQRNQAYASLSEALQSHRYAELKQNWQDFLVSNEFATGKGSQHKIGKFANKHIIHIYKTVLSEGKSIGPASPVEAFHQLRKSCKKLRYLLEMFRGLYPSSQVKVLIKELKILQDDLGELQDLEAHSEILQNYLSQEISDKDAKHEPVNTIQQLIDKMHIRKQVIMENFHEKFSLFASKKVKKMFTDLLGLKNI
jgi:CHAD domain-containing protein